MDKEERDDMGYTLGSLIQIARGLAAQFGADCEILIHDLLSADPEHTIVHVENGLHLQHGA